MLLPFLIVSNSSCPTNSPVFLNQPKLAVPLYFAVKGFKGLLTKTPEEVAQDNIDQAIVEQQNAGISLSYPLAQYNVLADMLEEATDTAFTDEETVYSVFRQLKNNADLLQLVKAYGERRHFEFGIPLGSYTLPQILVAVLDSGEIQEVRNILVSNGISTIIV